VGLESRKLGETEGDCPAANSGPILCCSAVPPTFTKGVCMAEFELFALCQQAGHLINNSLETVYSWRGWVPKRNLKVLRPGWGKRYGAVKAIDVC